MSKKQETLSFTQHSVLITHYFISAVIADGFNGARLEGFFAEGAFFFGFGLLANVGIAFFVGACKVIRRGIAAYVAVYAVVST